MTIKTLSAGPFKIKVDGTEHTGSGRHHPDVANYVSVEVPPEQYHELQQEYYELERRVRAGLEKQGFKLQESFRFDLGTEEEVMPVEKKMQGGETFDEKALISGISHIVDTFVKEKYPQAAAVGQKSSAFAERK